MKVAVIGGGPAGLYFSLLHKKGSPADSVVLLERNAPDATYGWGVVFVDATLERLRTADPESCDAMVDNFAHWDDIDVHVKGRTITSGGHGFSGIARRTLLDILRRRAESVGVELRFGCEVEEDGALASHGLGDADLVVAADGADSRVRRRHADVLGPDLDQRPARFLWLGTTRRFEAFTFIFVETPAGVFQAHAYRFDENQAAFIVECDERSWRNAGFDTMDVARTVEACERMFAPWLDGHPLLENVPPHLRAAPWTRFTRVRCARWHDGNVVLVGDAAHTAHFSIGSGTKQAMEDAIALAHSLRDLAHGHESLASALGHYEDARATEALRLQNAARNSMEWFENVRRYMRLAPEQFVYSLLTRSQRVSHEDLRIRDRGHLAGAERWFASRAAGDGRAICERGRTVREPPGPGTRRSGGPCSI